jgi:hypothetical protein
MQDFTGQILDQSNLAPGHVRLPSGLGIQGAYGLAHSAFHAAYQLIIELLQALGQLMYIGHISPQ